MKTPTSWFSGINFFTIFFLLISAFFFLIAIVTHFQFQSMIDEGIAFKGTLSGKTIYKNSFYRTGSDKPEYEEKYRFSFSYINPDAGDQIPKFLYAEVSADEYAETKEGDNIDVVCNADFTVCKTRRSANKVSKGTALVGGVLLFAALLTVVSYSSFRKSKRGSIIKPEPKLKLKGDEHSIHAPDGSWRIDIDWNSGRMSHYIACPVVYDKNEQIIFSLAGTYFQICGHHYSKPYLSIDLEEYPDSGRYSVSLNLDDQTATATSYGLRVTAKASIKDLHEKLNDLR